MLARPEPALRSLDPGHPCIGCGVRASAVCGALRPEALRDFRLSGTAVHYPAGATIVLDGDFAATVFSLTDGVLRLSKLLSDGRRQVTGFLFPGDFLGVTMEPEHNFTAEAVAPAILCRFSRARFEEFLDTDPGLKERLFDLAARDLADTRQHLVLLGQKTAAERVASFLISAAGRCPGGRHGDVHLPMSRLDIADYLGLRIETISRELTFLKTSGTVRITGRNSLRILDLDRLRSAAGQ